MLVLLTAAVIFAIRLAGPPDLMDHDQERPAAYVLDAVQNGHWICQRDWMGDVMSKPPLYTWLSAAATLPFKQINRFSLYLPAAISVGATACLILLVGRSFFGPSAGFFGALMLLLSPIMSRQIALARTDGLFMFTIAAAAFVAFKAWTSGRSWFWFWLIAAAATLTKGPLGVLLAACGLIAVFWDRRGERGDRPSAIGGNLVGIAVFLLITLGWFWLAYRSMGQPLIDRMLSRELIGHVVASDQGEPPLMGFFKPALYFLYRYAPWSILSLIGLWQVLKQTAATEPERRLERFLFCWFLAGLLIFSLAPHQRGDLLAPIIPPAALLAGRVLARWLKNLNPVRVNWGVGLSTVVGAILIAVFYQSQRDDIWVQRTIGMQKLAAEIRKQAGDGFPLVHMEDPFALQFYLNTMTVMTSPEKAAEILAGPKPAFVALCDFGKLERQWEEKVDIHELARWPDESGEPFVRIVGNRRNFESAR